jgi:hypothetical protein
MARRMTPGLRLAACTRSCRELYTPFEDLVLGINQRNGAHSITFG